MDTMDTYGCHSGLTIDQMLLQNSLVIKEVPGDGHCFLNAVQEVLRCDEQLDISTSDLIREIEKEFSTNFFKYKDLFECVSIMHKIDLF